jgi:hypothetical protein
MKTRRFSRNQLEITILKQGTPFKNVISCSFFTSIDGYRKREKYVKALNKFLAYKKQLKGFETRIYTDDSEKEYLMDLVKKDPTVSIYHYNFPPLRNETGHIGIFGAFVRFLPLFEHGLRAVWISDVDIVREYLNPSILAKARAAKADFCFRSFVCYEQIKLYGRSYSILAGTMLSFHTFPKAMFNNFLQELVHPSRELSIFFDKLNKENKTYRLRSENKVPYGFDEVFTNKHMYNYLIRNNLRCYILKEYEYASNLLRWNNIIEDRDENDMAFYDYYSFRTPVFFKKAKQAFREKLPLIADKYPCIQDMIKKLDSFKHDFIEIHIKTGKELDEKL